MIRVSGLSKKFRDQVAIDGVSFDVVSGECFVLLGPNGSGKTTTLKSLAGLVLPSSGTISIHGFDVASGSEPARRAISYLPQQVAFPDHLRVREVLQFYARLRRLPSARIESVMRMLDCEQFAGRFVSELSGGMRQRLAIAIACLPDSPVLLLDEPTASLDPESAADFRLLLADLKRAGKTLLLATHVLADVEALADRIAILVNGRLLAVETVETLKRGLAASQRVHVLFHRSAPPHSAAVARAAGALSAGIKGSELIVVAEQQRCLSVLQAVDTSSGGSIERFWTEEATLEEIYLRYVHEDRVRGDSARAFDSLPVPAAAAC